MHVRHKAVPGSQVTLLFLCFYEVRLNALEICCACPLYTGFAPIYAKLHKQFTSGELSQAVS